MTYGNDMKYQFHCPQIKFYWNIATFIHLLFMAASGIQWWRLYGPQWPKWYLLSGPLQKKFANPSAIEKRFQVTEEEGCKAPLTIWGKSNSRDFSFQSRNNQEQDLPSYLRQSESWCKKCETIVFRHYTPRSIGLQSLMEEQQTDKPYNCPDSA